MNKSVIRATTANSFTYSEVILSVVLALPLYSFAADDLDHCVSHYLENDEQMEKSYVHVINKCNIAISYDVCMVLANKRGEKREYFFRQSHLDGFNSPGAGSRVGFANWDNQASKYQIRYCELKLPKDAVIGNTAQINTRLCPSDCPPDFPTEEEEKKSEEANEL
jgi:hypothetical protein